MIVINRLSESRHPLKRLRGPRLSLAMLLLMVPAACNQPPVPGSSSVPPRPSSGAIDPGSLAPGPPRLVGDEYLFTLLEADARTVAVVGSFNGWVPTRSLLERHGDLWHGQVAVPLGRHKYRFLIDGTRWVLDPDNPRQARDNLGALASLLVVSK